MLGACSAQIPRPAAGRPTALTAEALRRGGESPNFM